MASKHSIQSLTLEEFLSLLLSTLLKLFLYFLYRFWRGLLDLPTESADQTLKVVRKNQAKLASG